MAMQVHRNIVIPTNHEKPVVLDAFFNANGRHQPVVVFAHGFKGFKDWGPFDLVAEYFANNGFAFVKMNFSHNGTTPEAPDQFVDLEAFAENNFSRELDDLAAVFDWVSTTDLFPESVVDRDNLNLIGHSRGGSTAIIKTGEDQRVKKLITWSAPNDIESRWDPETLEQWETNGVIYIENARTGQQLPMNYQLIEDYFNNKTRFHIRNIVENMDRPIMVAHGTEDEAVPSEQALELKKWNPRIQLELIPGTGHTFGAAHPYDKNQLPSGFQHLLKSCVAFLKGKKR